MANTRELRRRIKSVNNTSQITRAMEMVTATKMRRAQHQALAGRPYLEALNRSLYHLLNTGKRTTHSFLEPNDSDRTAILVFSTDKSLCGALNTNLFRNIAALKNSQDWDLQKELIYISVGRKVQQFIVKTSRRLEADFTNPEVVDFVDAVRIQKFLRKLFLEQNISSVYILYPHFVSVLNQTPTLLKILPIQKTWGTEGQLNLKEEFIFEPDKEVLVEYLLTHYLESQLYQAMLETKASEHSSRMIAMRNATDNAQELANDLKLSYNQIRQDSITSELSEITGAVLAME